jgi:hypothetical protein
VTEAGANPAGVVPCVAGVGDGVGVAVGSVGGCVGLAGVDCDTDADAFGADERPVTLGWSPAVVLCLLEQAASVTQPKATITVARVVRDDFTTDGRRRWRRGCMPVF